MEFSRRVSHELLFILLLIAVATVTNINAAAPAVQKVPPCVSRSKALGVCTETLDLLDSIALDSKASKELKDIIKNTSEKLIGDFDRLELARTSAALRELLSKLRSAAYKNFTLSEEARGWIIYSGQQFKYYYSGSNARIPILKSVLNERLDSLNESKAMSDAIRKDLTDSKELLDRVRAYIQNDRTEVINKIEKEATKRKVTDKVEEAMLMGLVCTPVVFGTAVVATAASAGTATVAATIAALGVCTTITYNLVKNPEVSLKDKVDVFNKNMDAMVETYNSLGHILDKEIALVDERTRRVKPWTESTFCRMESDFEEIIDPKYERSVVDRFGERYNHYSMDPVRNVA